MRSKFSLLLIVATLVAGSFSSTVHAQCCRVPDSLKVNHITDSSFCFQWDVNDSLGCDTARSFQIQFKPATATNWKTKTKTFTGGLTLTYCDTGTACTKYKWQIRKLCVHNGDSTYTAWVPGRNFTLKCDSTDTSHLNKTRINNSFSITPNPGRSTIVISGNYTGVIAITISNMQGQKLLDTKVNTANKVAVPINVSSFNKGMYFVNIFDGHTSTKLNFLKE